MYFINKSLAHRLEMSEAAHWESVMQGLPAHYRSARRHFGLLVALACPGMAERYFVNRVIGVRESAESDLTAAVDWLAEQRLPCRVDVCPLLAQEATLAHLHKLGFVMEGFQMALFGAVERLAVGERRAMPPGVEIREASDEGDLAFAARAMPVAFDSGGEPWLTWLTDSMNASFQRPDWRTYVALVDGKYAGFAQLHVAEGVGTLTMAGTLPEFRTRGVQSAFIHRRIEDAAAMGCDLVAAQTGNGTVSQWNMERAGLRVAYTKAEFYRRP